MCALSMSRAGGPSAATPDAHRYARQIALSEVGTAGQARLAAASVLVVGAGGLGCPVLQYLAGAGVGRLVVIDPDHVEIGNLHRQPLYRMADLGRPKADAARAHLLSANPGIEVRALTRALGPGNAGALIADADVVVDAADSHAVSYILSDACLAAGRVLVSASVLGRTGYVGTFCGGVPSLRAVFPAPPISAATCASAGVMGPVVGLIGTLQAQMVLDVLLGFQPSPLGRLVTFDATGMRFGGFDFRSAPEPDAPIPFVARTDLTPADRVIELRPKAEAPLPATHDAIRLSADALTGLPRDDRRIVLCCASGLRAWRAAETMRAAGHDRLALLATAASE